MVKINVILFWNDIVQPGRWLLKFQWNMLS
jgi:hypothetical protein